MFRPRLFHILALSLCASFWISGCDTSRVKNDGKAPPASAGSEAAKTPTDEDAAKIEASLAQLSPEDRKAAEQQAICPVSGEKLGTMDKPYKVTVKGQDVFLCCSGCEEDLKNDPDKYLAKLKK